MASGDVIRLGSNLKRTYPRTGNPIAGRVVQMLENGSVAALPLRNYDLNGYTYLATGSNNNASNRALLPTTDPAVWVMTYRSDALGGGGGDSYYNYARLVYMNGASATLIAPGASVGHYSATSQASLRVGNSNVFVIFAFGSYGNYMTGFTVNTATRTITTGTQNWSPTDINRESGSVIYPVSLSDNAFALIWSDTPNGAVRATYFSITNAGVITQGSTVTVFSSGTASTRAYDIGGAFVATDTILCRGFGKLAVIRRSGTTFTVGNAVNIPNISGSSFVGDSETAARGIAGRAKDYFEVLNSTQVLFVYGGSNTAGRLCALVATISSNTVTLGTTAVLFTNSLGSVATHNVMAISVFDRGGNKRLISFSNNPQFSNGLGYQSYLLSINISGTSITSDGNLFAINATGNNAPSYIRVNIADVLADGSILLDCIANANVTSFIRLRMESNNTFTFLNTYKTNANFGTRNNNLIKVGSYYFLFYGSTIGSSAGNFFGYRRFTTFEIGQIWGIYQMDGATLLKGISDGHDNLVVGLDYYYNPSNGIVGTEPLSPAITHVPIGKAISPMEIYMETPLNDGIK